MNDKVQKVIRYPNRIPIDNIAALRQLLGKEPNDYVILLGKDRKGDNDAREYYWLPDSVAIDDGDLVIKPSIVDGSSPGRWHKVLALTGGDGTFRGYKGTIVGNGTGSSFFFDHPFSTLDVMVQVYKADNGETVETVETRALGGVTITFKTIPQTGEQFKVLIITF
jgi:hypothetical protein